MKKMLLLLALIVAPAWAADVTPAPSTQKPMAMEIAPIAKTRIAPSVQQSAAAQTAPVAEPGVVIELKGSAKSESALVADLEKDAVFKNAACSTKPAKRASKTVRITCTKADGELLNFLSKNAQAVHWSISGTAPKIIARQLMSTTTGTCYRLTCAGVTACFQRGCTGPCTGC